MAIFLEFPLTIVQRAHLTRFQPSRDAVEMERMITNAPGNGTFLTGGRCLIGLTFDAQVHDVITTNGTVVHHNVPGPQSDGAPFLNLKAFLRCFVVAAAGLLEIILVDLHFSFVCVPWNKRTMTVAIKIATVDKICSQNRMHCKIYDKHDQSVWLAIC